MDLLLWVWFCSLALRPEMMVCDCRVARLVGVVVPPVSTRSVHLRVAPVTHRHNQLKVRIKS